MNSREKILQAVLKNQPALTALPDSFVFKGTEDDKLQKYMDVFRNIGGSVFLVDGIEAIRSMIREQFDTSKRMVTTLPFLSDMAEFISAEPDPHLYEDIELAVISPHFVVAENGAAWFTEEVMGQRIIPYICQHLAIVINTENIVPTLHEAYEKIGAGDYSFGGFIAGPSKTADIEQALVLGAHGPLTMTVYIIQ
jgi:L-lactate dehydrogenase complex protein LldG